MATAAGTGAPSRGIRRIDTTMGAAASSGAGVWRQEVGRGCGPVYLGIVVAIVGRNCAVIVDKSDFMVKVVWSEAYDTARAAELHCARFVARMLDGWAPSIWRGAGTPVESVLWGFRAVDRTVVRIPLV